MPRSSGSPAAGCCEVLDEIGHPELRSTVITIGAMIETPRAALTAGALAEHADFFSFGTNDLTQMTYAFSRDDVEAALLPAYRAFGVMPDNPFAVLDQDGVGELIRLACRGPRDGEAGDQARCVRRARRPPSVGRLPGPPRCRLGELLTVPRADGPPRGRPGPARLRAGADQRDLVRLRRCPDPPAVALRRRTAR